MADNNKPDTPFSRAQKQLEAGRKAHVELFERNKASYDLYHDAGSTFGYDYADENFGAAAAIVQKIGDSQAALISLGDALYPALVDSLVEHLISLATASKSKTDKSVIGRLRNDLNALDAYRSESLDGRTGQFWRVVCEGRGADPKERDGMLNRLLAAWGEVYGTKPKLIVAAASSLCRLPAAYEAFDEAAYPFDLEVDLTEMISWAEIDQDAVGRFIECRELAQAAKPTI